MAVLLQLLLALGVGAQLAYSQDNADWRNVEWPSLHRINKNWRLPADLPINTLVQKNQYVDKEVGGNVTFGLPASNENDGLHLFRIDNTTGEVYLTADLSDKVGQRYNVYITAEYPGGGGRHFGIMVDVVQPNGGHVIPEEDVFFLPFTIDWRIPANLPINTLWVKLGRHFKAGVNITIELRTPFGYRARGDDMDGSQLFRLDNTTGELCLALAADLSDKVGQRYNLFVAKSRGSKVLIHANKVEVVPPGSDLENQTPPGGDLDNQTPPGGDIVNQTPSAGQQTPTSRSSSAPGPARPGRDVMYQLCLYGLLAIQCLTLRLA